MKTISLTLPEKVYTSVKRLAEDEGAELTSFLAALIADEVIARFKKHSGVRITIDNSRAAINSSPKGIKIREKLTHKEKGKLRREAFIENLQKKGIKIKHFKGAIYKTEIGRIVGIASATEFKWKKGYWFLGLPAQNYDLLVLLCETIDGKLLSFIFSSEFLKENSPNFILSGGNYKFHIFMKNGKYYTKFPDTGWLDVNRFLDNIEVLKDIITHNAHPKSKKTKLRVTFPDGHFLEDRIAASTFIKTLSEIGFQKVESLGISVRGVPLVGFHKSSYYQQRRIGNRFIITHSSTDEKKNTLEEISGKLDIGLKIDIVE